MNTPVLGKDTPVTVRVGLIIAALGLAGAVGAWMSSVNSDTSALPKILRKIDDIEKKGTSAGRQSDELIRKDLDALGEKLDTQGKAVQRVEETLGAQRELLREMDSKIDRLGR